MYPTMHIRIHVEILIPHGIEHTQRLLRRGRIIKINQRLSVHLAPQDGEVLTYLIDVVHVFFL